MSSEMGGVTASGVLTFLMRREARGIKQLPRAKQQLEPGPMLDLTMRISMSDEVITRQCQPNPQC